MWPLVWSGFPYKHGELGSRGESWEREMERRRKGERGGRELVETTWTLWTWKSHSVTSTTFYWSKQLQSPLGFGRQGHRLHNSVVECRIVRGHIKWDVYWYSHLWTIHSMQEGWASVQFGCSVVSDSLRPHELQHARLPCPWPTPRAYSNSCPSSQWCHPTVSSSVVPFSSHLHSFPASGSFPVSQFITSGGQSIGISASASVLPVNSQDWFPFGLTGLISLLSKGLSGVFSNTTVQKHQFFAP